MEAGKWSMCICTLTGLCSSVYSGLNLNKSNFEGGYIYGRKRRSSFPVKTSRNGIKSFAFKYIYLRDYRRLRITHPRIGNDILIRTRSASLTRSLTHTDPCPHLAPSCLLTPPTRLSPVASFSLAPPLCISIDLDSDVFRGYLRLQDVDYLLLLLENGTASAGYI